MTTALRQPPWKNAEIVRAAVGLACDVRQIDTNAIRKELERKSPARIADIAVALAALVDVDRTLKESLRWTTETPEADDDYALQPQRGRSKND